MLIQLGTGSELVVQHARLPAQKIIIQKMKRARSHSCTVFSAPDAYLLFPFVDLYNSQALLPVRYGQMEPSIPL